jgi:hypothetical protein
VDQNWGRCGSSWRFRGQRVRYIPSMTVHIV